jgi:DNA polymerase
VPTYDILDAGPLRRFVVLSDAGPLIVHNCGFRLGGGDIVEGKKTGLYGYAEKMGINLSRDLSHQAVKLFRDTYPEIPELWYALEKAARQCMETGKPAKAGEWLTFERRAPYLMLRLPSGRYIYYFQPKMVKLWFAKHPRTGQMKPLGQDEARAENAKAKGWEVYSKINLSYMGKPQNKPGWVRLPTHGGKLVENAVQSVARDVLKEGMLSAADDGFIINLHVYDEIGTLHPKSDTYHTVERLCEIMSRPIPWAPGLLLGAAGWAGPYYKKD